MIDDRRSLHVIAELPRFVVGRLQGAQLEAVQDHLTACFHCSVRAIYLQRRYDALREEMAAVASFEAILELSLTELDTKGRFEAFASRIAALLAIPEIRAHEILHTLATGRAAWQAGPRPGISLLPLEHGAGVVQGFAIRIASGITYPMHRHDGTEHLFIIQGGLVDHDGAQIWRGDSAVFRPGTAHASTAIAGNDCVLVVSSEGSTILDP